ncbi:MAG: GAF domain-containing protein [bacterium]
MARDRSGDKSNGSPGGTLRSYLKRGEAFIDEILRHNESLRLRVLQLESQLFMDNTPVPPPAAVSELRLIFQQLHREHEDLQNRLDEVAYETEQYKERYSQIEDENDRLVNLFVAGHQLYSTLDLASAVQIIMEILLNFIGAGRFCITILDEPSGELHAIESYGVPLDKVPSYSKGQEPLAAAIATGKPVVVEPMPEQWDVNSPLVCIPLRLANEVVGAVMIYSYLEQKREISDIDRELFSLLGDRAGAVLESARLFATSARGPRSFSAYLALMTSEGGHE